MAAPGEENNLKRYVYAVVLEDKRRFGDLKVTDVRPPQIRAVLMSAVAAGLAKGTVKHIRAAMNRLFGSAWQNELIPENPVLKVKLPKMRELKKARVVLTDQERAWWEKWITHERSHLPREARQERGRIQGDPRHLLREAAA